VGAIAAAVLVSAGIAYAQSSGTDAYSGCLAPGGVITDVAIGHEPLRECDGNRIAISWNQTGPEGPIGPQGPQGDTGSQGPQGEAGPGQADIEEIRSQLDSLLEVIQIDPDTGAVTIISPADLTLDAIAEVVIEGDAMLMDGATVMGETMLEGDTMLMQDATVMGETMLEGDTMLMENAEFMGDATFEGGLVLPDTALTVIDGELIPTSSSVTITGFIGGSPLERIPPAAESGTVLEIHFGVSSDDIGSQGFVSPCFFCFGYSNIDLQQRPGDPLLFESGDTLRLISRGDSWVEVSRSSGHVEAFSLLRTRRNWFGTTFMSARCTDPPTEGTLIPGRDRAVLLTTSINIVEGDIEIVRQETVVDYDGTEVVYVTLQNNGLEFAAEAQLVLRCLSI